jgi:tetratricopeptide (TPR) repeat protein
MTAFPDALLNPIRAEGEELIGMVLTTGQHAFVHETETAEAPVWWVVTTRRCWFISVDEQATWFVADGDPELIRIKSSWTETRVWIGPWNMPLRSGTRRPAKQLLKRWEKLAAGASPLPKEAGQVLLLVGSAAEGAHGLPSWWASRIAGRPDERWLLGINSGLYHPFNAHDGTILHVPITIGISDQRTALAARSPWGELWSEELPEPLRLTKPLVGKLKVMVNQRRFYAARGSLERLKQVALFQGEPPERRWAVAANRALIKGVPLRATSLWSEAIRLKLAGAIWYDLAGTAMAYGKHELAATILFRAVGPTTTSPFGAWSKRLKPIRVSLKNSKVTWEQVQRTLHPTMERFQVPEPPEGLPFPPANPTETWAYALCCSQRWREAQAMWASLPDSAHARQGIAACLRADPATDGNEAWREAALAWRREGQQEEAYAALERVAALDGQALDRWLRAQWAWEDGHKAVAHQWWTKALAADSTGQSRKRGELSSAALHALAAHAIRIELPQAALHALHELVEQDASDVLAYYKQAQIAERVEEDIEKAAQLLLQATTHEEVLSRSEEPLRWQVWSQLGRHQAHMGQQEQALSSMAEAISGDFLQPKAYEAALGCDDLELPPALATWWRQLLALLTDGALIEDPLHFPPERLNAEELAKLHPGGTSWLEQFSSSLQDSQLPQRNQLVRGLEATNPGEPAALQVLSEALHIPCPEAYWFRGEGAFGCSSWPLSPPLVLIGHQHAEEGPRAFSAAQWRFALGAELAHLKCEHPVLTTDENLVDSGKSAFRAFGKYAGTASNIVDIITLIPGVDQVAKLQKLIRMSRALAATHSTLDKAGEAAIPALTALGLLKDPSSHSTAGREGWAGAALQNRIHADRVGLLLCGDPVAAIWAILKSSSSSLHHLDSLGEQGILHLLSRELPPDEVIRIGALFEYCAQQRPDQWMET